jgi:hypothetical protein
VGLEACHILLKLAVGFLAIQSVRFAVCDLRARPGSVSAVGTL